MLLSRDSSLQEEIQMICNENENVAISTLSKMKDQQFATEYVDDIFYFQTDLLRRRTIGEVMHQQQSFLESEQVAHQPCENMHFSTQLMSSMNINQRQSQQSSVIVPSAPALSQPNIAAICSSCESVDSTGTCKAKRRRSTESVVESFGHHVHTVRAGSDGTVAASSEESSFISRKSRYRRVNMTLDLIITPTHALQYFIEKLWRPPEFPIYLSRAVLKSVIINLLPKAASDKEDLTTTIAAAIWKADGSCKQRGQSLYRIGNGDNAYFAIKKPDDTAAPAFDIGAALHNPLPLLLR